MLTRAHDRLRRLVGKLRFTPAVPEPSRPPHSRQEYAIGIYAGGSPLQMATLPELKNPVLTREHISDVPAMFIADPFMLKVEGAWYMFFEVWNQATSKGEIALATSQDGMTWTYQQMVLTEPFHLSYPYVFEWSGEYYMIPESYEAGSIRLYKAVNFPVEWALMGTLLSGPLGKMRFVDNSVFRHNGRWWLFTETDAAFRMGILRLYYADALLGPWREHRKSPIVRRNNRCARPAGRVLTHEGRLLRYAQDCYPFYGSQVRAFEIAELTPKRYREREVDESPVLTASGSGWNRDGMHHIDPHLQAGDRWMACVDGWCWVGIEDGKPCSPASELEPAEANRAVSVPTSAQRAP